MSEQLARVQNQEVLIDQPGNRRFSSRVTAWRLQVIHIRPVRLRRLASKTRARNLQVTLREWHKRAGLFAFIFMGWLGTSGILLNQSVSLGLDADRIDWPWLIAMYGLHAEAPKSGFSANSHWLAATVENTVLDGQPLDQAIPAPLGFVSQQLGGQELLYVAAADRLVILNADGSVVDQLSDYTLPVASIRRIGLVNEDNGSLVAVQDLDIFVTRDGLDWVPLPPGMEVSWSKAQALPAPEQEKVLPHARPSIAIEQVLIDAHSGRLFGSVGPWVINMVGVAALVLSISGIWMLWRSSRRRRQAANA